MAQHFTFRRHKLHLYRKVKGLTLKQVAAATGVSIGRLSFYERDMSEPGVLTALILAEFYGTTVKKIWGKQK